MFILLVEPAKVQTLGLKEAESRSLMVNWTSPVDPLLRETRKVLFNVTWCGFDKRQNKWMKCSVSIDCYAEHLWTGLIDRLVLTLNFIFSCEIDVVITRVYCRRMIPSLPFRVN